NVSFQSQLIEARVDHDAMMIVTLNIGENQLASGARLWSGVTQDFITSPSRHLVALPQPSIWHTGDSPWGASSLRLFASRELWSTPFHEIEWMKRTGYRLIRAALSCASIHWDVNDRWRSTVRIAASGITLHDRTLIKTSGEMAGSIRAQHTR